ncbi:hypothetical protein JNJ66_05500 [Candidatus Saccharibacteria bacterium]|nr:hypothetical protein [Candidatus Saccharibacteria bacterium]
MQPMDEQDAIRLPHPADTHRQTTATGASSNVAGAHDPDETEPVYQREQFEETGEE